MAWSGGLRARRPSLRRGAERRQRGPVGLSGGAEPNTRERADRKAPIADFQAHRAAALLVQVAMRGEKSILLMPRQPRHAVDVVMAVALDVEIGRAHV